MKWSEGILKGSLIILVVSSTVSSPSEPTGTTAEQKNGLNQFFGSIDRDGDGQIEPAEALSYIGANFDERDINESQSKAAERIYQTLEGTDADATISKAEVEKHLKRLLKGKSVSEWLKHSAQMPQYVQAFRDNQVTSLDFPMLVSDGGHTLEHELGVKSKLHQEQLIRAIKRVILGIGAPPSSPQGLQCRGVTCSTVLLSWGAPEQVGQPPMHKYKLERQQIVKGTAEVITLPQWVTIAELADEDEAYQDSNLEAGSFRYRLTAWNAYGWSEYAETPECVTSNKSLPCPITTCKGSACLPDSVLMSSTDSRGIWKLDQIGLMSVTVTLIVLSAAVAFGRISYGSKVNELPGKATASKNRIVEADLPVAALTTDLLPSKTVSFKDLVAAESEREVPASGASAFSDPESESGKSPRRRKMSARRSSLRLADADCFTPRDLDMLRAPSLLRSADHLDGLGQRPAPAGDGESTSFMTESPITWLDDQGVEIAAPGGLEATIVPEGGDKHKCAFPGCNRSLRVIVSLKAAMTCHYCSLCQNLFCHHHTRHSPHGMLGSCGIESKCICQICYDDLPRTTQERLEKLNKLHKSSKREDGSKTPKMRRIGSTLGGSVSGSSSNSLQALAKSGKGHWAKFRTAWRAAKNFQGAGDERRRRTTEEGATQPDSVKHTA